MNIDDSRINLETTQAGSYSEKQNSTLIAESELRELFKKCIFKDPYHNCKINLSNLKEANEKQVRQVVDKIFSELIENKESYQHLVVQIAQTQTRVYKCLVNKGFKIHHSEDGTLFFKLCLDHQDQKCAYPPYKTMSIGITAVVFNDSLTQFLAVQEKSGPYQGWKAPTGSVDYEKEDEFTAVIREVQEETHLKIDHEQLILVGMAPTQNLRGRSPDRNFVFTCKINQNNEIKAQEEEIKQVSWLSVEDFLASELPVSHQSRPLILQEVVRIAKEALEKNQGWRPISAYWGSGRPATLYR